jgi:predicted transcriptional regulator
MENVETNSQPKYSTTLDHTALRQLLDEFRARQRAEGRTEPPLDLDAFIQQRRQEQAESQTAVIRGLQAVQEGRFVEHEEAMRRLEAVLDG